MMPMNWPGCLRGEIEDVIDNNNRKIRALLTQQRIALIDGISQSSRKDAIVDQTCHTIVVNWGAKMGISKQKGKHGKNSN
jgi:hypothetical protein